MILVTGATGNIGGQVARQLAAMRITARALVRDLAKGAALEALGVELVQGSFDQPETLEKALEGIDSAFLLIADDPNHLEFLNNFLQAAQKNKVQHLVVLSGEGAAQDSPRLFSRWHWEREQAVIASGIPYTFIKPVYVMENFLSYRTTINQQNRFFAPLAPDYKLSMVAAADIAAVAVVALTHEGHYGKEYVVTGPEALSFSDAAQELTKSLGRNISYVQISEATLKKQLTNMGQPDWLVEAVVNILHSPATVVTNIVATVTGRPPIPFAQFLNNNIEAFRSA